MPKDNKIKVKYCYVQALTEDEISSLIAGTYDPNLRLSFALVLDNFRTTTQQERFFNSLWKIVDRNNEDIIYAYAWTSGRLPKGNTEFNFYRTTNEIEEYKLKDAVILLLQLFYSVKDIYSVTVHLDKCPGLPVEALRQVNFKNTSGDEYVFIKPNPVWCSLFICLGSCLGLAIGSSVGNSALGISLGGIFGLILGGFIDMKERERRERIVGDEKYSSGDDDEINS